MCCNCESNAEAQALALLLFVRVELRHVSHMPAQGACLLGLEALPTGAVFKHIRRLELETMSLRQSVRNSTIEVFRLITTQEADSSDWGEVESRARIGNATFVPEPSENDPFESVITNKPSDLSIARKRSRSSLTWVLTARTWS